MANFEIFEKKFPVKVIQVTYFEAKRPLLPNFLPTLVTNHWLVVNQLLEAWDKRLEIMKMYLFHGGNSIIGSE